MPYKNHLLAVDVAERAGRPVVVAGTGPLLPVLRERAATASVPVVVLDRPSHDTVRELLRRAAVLVFPTVEDFGIVPVEAMASGTPVLAPRRGGSGETVLDGVSGALVDELTVGALAEALPLAEACTAADCRTRALAFDVDRFTARIRDWVGEHTGVLRP